MKVILVILAIASPVVQAVNPVSKVIQLLSDLEAKITAEGAQAKTEFIEFTAWCKDRSRELAFEIKTGKSTSADLSATIAQESATTASLTSKFEERSGNLATDEADLAAATHIREMERSDFAAENAELSEAIDTLSRAIAMLEKEAAKGGASMLQVNNAVSLAQALSIVVDAGAISAADSAKLTALVQASQGEEDVGAPASAVYQSHSGNIIETLKGIWEKADAQLAALRHSEELNLQFPVAEIVDRRRNPLWEEGHGHD
jgi:flagellin-like hook-associated protein FlgL